ncbi:MAG TPA: hypothetical protein VKB57_25420 [Acidimicrobiales bacterium]|nr:hypothetical protein [Acidimicrobiales bacterium]
MLGTTELLLTYYLGVGFVVVLAWAALQPSRRVDDRAAGRYFRWSTVVAAAGLLHPAVPLAARDIVGQVALDIPDDNATLQRMHRRAASATNALTIVSLFPLVALGAIGLT